jgi:hypothetical protein
MLLMYFKESKWVRRVALRFYTEDYVLQKKIVGKKRSLTNSGLNRNGLIRCCVMFNGKVLFVAVNDSRRHSRL